MSESADKDVVHVRLIIPPWFWIFILRSAFVRLSSVVPSVSLFLVDFLYFFFFHTIFFLFIVFFASSCLIELRGSAVGFTLFIANIPSDWKHIYKNTDL